MASLQNLKGTLKMAETIGLDIGSHSIKVVGIQMNSKGPFLTHAGIKEIPYGEQRDDPTFISEAIKAVYREAGLNPGKVNLTLSGADIHIRQITLPSMPKSELREAVRWEMKNHLPFPVESAQIDFHILGESGEKDLKKLDLVAVACPRHLIDRLLAIAEGAGLKPVHLGVGPFALQNLMSAFGHFQKEGVIGLVDLGAEKTGIYLFQAGVLQFSREVTPGGMDLTRAIMEGMDSDEEHPLLYDRAEKIKQEMGIPSQVFYEKTEDQSSNGSKIPYLVRPVLERLMAEIARSLDYYRNQSHLERIDRLYLTGGGANTKNIATYLSETLRLPVERLNPFDRILSDAKKIDAQFLDQKGPAFAVALGTAIPHRKQIELLPAKEPYWSKARMERWIPRLAALITLLVFAWFIWDLSAQVTNLKKDRDEKMAKVKTVEMLQAKFTVLKEKENKMKADLSLFPSSTVAPVPFRKALTEISQIVPDNVTVTLLAIQSEKISSDKKASKEESPVNGAYELQMKGIAFGSDSSCLTALARIIEELERSSLFKNAKLVSADENKSYNQPGVGFEILCDLEHESNPTSLPLTPSTAPFLKGGEGGISKEGRGGFAGGKK
jgi:type IV pilus assembly protein PilM